MPDTAAGLTMDEYVEYTQLIDLHLFYAGMSGTKLEVDFEKAIDDTIRRWKFIASWTRRLSNKNVTNMKDRTESHRITEIMMLDEPLCFEDMVCRKAADRCRCCPLWHITGHPCEHILGLKYKVTFAWVKSRGFFYPNLFVNILKKIKTGEPIYEVDLDIFTGVW